MHVSAVSRMLVALARRTRHNRPHGSGSFYQAGFALDHGGDDICLWDRQKHPVLTRSLRVARRIK